MPAWRASHHHRQFGLGQLVENPVSLQRAGHDASELGGLFDGQVQPLLIRHPQNLFEAGVLTGMTPPTRASFRSRPRSSAETGGEILKVVHIERSKVLSRANG